MQQLQLELGDFVRVTAPKSRHQGRAVKVKTAVDWPLLIGEVDGQHVVLLSSEIERVSEPQKAVKKTQPSMGEWKMRFEVESTRTRLLEELIAEMLGQVQDSRLIGKARELLA